MISLTRHILFLGCLILLWGCKKEQLDDCFTSTGPESSEVRELPQFNKLKLYDKYEVVLRQDTQSSPSVRISGGKHLLPGIIPVVENGILEFKNENTCNFVRSFKNRIKLEITLQNLDELILSAAPLVSNLDTLRLQKLDIWHSALSDIELNLIVEERVFVQAINSSRTVLHGMAGKLEGSIEEVADLDARDLMCKEVLMDSHTPLDCYINASEIIFVKIYNRGNIFYKGGEPIKQKELNVQKGSGQLLPLDP
ncbi:MAG: DUF2807 domain-containing protein [Flavobacteriales bacterium]|nr:DUF2807 domain-containing protein [Flavobacteriales bacterium]